MPGGSVDSNLCFALSTPNSWSYIPLQPAWPSLQHRRPSLPSCRYSVHPRVLLGKSRVLPSSASPAKIAATNGYSTSGESPACTLNLLQPFADLEDEELRSKLPINTYTAKSPLKARIKDVRSLVGSNAPGDVFHIVVDHGGALRYVEGQSLGVVPPGTNPQTGKPSTTRLYSICSSRYGDDMTGQTVSLCVRRAVFRDPTTGEEIDEKKGLCSNFLCGGGGEGESAMTTGKELLLTGPCGKTMLLPERKPGEVFDNDLIFVATGTGVAPYRGFLRRLFVERTPDADAFQGRVWVVLGVANEDAFLYGDELSELEGRVNGRGAGWRGTGDTGVVGPDDEGRRSSRRGGGEISLNDYGSGEEPKAVDDDDDDQRRFRLDVAFSRKSLSPNGKKRYVGDVLKENAEEVFHRLEQRKAHIYFCGLKAMMPPILNALREAADLKGKSFDDSLLQWKKEKRWHVEVY